MTRLSNARLWTLCASFVLTAATAQAASLRLAWDPSPSAVGYVLYWANLPGNLPANFVGSLDVGNQTSFEVNGLTDGMPYYFVVRARNAAGMLSSPSTEVSRRVGVPFSVGGDFDLDRRADITVFRPSSGAWYIRGSSVSATYMWGGYVLNALYPEGHVFIDGRADMYGGDVLHEYQSIMSAMPGWQDKLESSGANAVLIEPNTPLARNLRSARGWSLAYEAPSTPVDFNVPFVLKDVALP